MKALFKLALIFCILLFIGCNPILDCNEIVEQITLTSEIEISTDEFINGFSVDTKNDRFFFKCLIKAKEPVIGQFHIDSTETKYTFKIKDNEATNFKQGDVLYAVFWDSNKYIRKYAAYNLIKVKIKHEPTPCDSIRSIVYTSAAKKIDKLTKDKIELVDLYDKVLENKIQEYLKSLNPIQKEQAEQCKKTFKLFDWIENSKEYGFQTSQFSLTPEIIDFLSILSKVIEEKTNEENWNYSKFNIRVIGYADERNLNSRISIKGGLGFNSTTKSKIILYDQANCKSVKKFFSLEDNKVNGTTISNVTDNCTLSAARAYSAILFIQENLKGKLKNQVNFEYAGGGVSKGKDYVKNRKIEVQIELKSGKEK